MCGINGIYGLKDEFRTRDVLIHMNSKLAHRGPDAQGVITRGGIGLGHRRLSIIDLTENGRQPMAGASAATFISFNGEIYNYQKLRKLCPNYDFKTDTDTEVILALYEQHGTACFEMLEGMFAIAIWDDRSKKLILARDRMGKKPLYYSWVEGVLVFSSEIRALLASGLVQPVLNKAVLPDYFQYQTVYSPNTILKDILQLQAGHFMVVSNGIVDTRKYWSIDRAKEKHSLTGPYDKVIKQTRELFFAAVEKRLMSDVPLGAFLSGGVDSSSVVAAMAKLSTTAVKTFNVYFEEDEFSEHKYAELVADKFKTDHHPIKLKASDFLDNLPDALAALDHPGVDGANSYIVSRYTKAAGITVALTGLGGDELFGGYPVFKYIKSLNRWRLIGKTPVVLRRNLFKLLEKRLPGSQRVRLMQIAELKDWNLNNLYPIFRTVFSNAELKGMGYNHIDKGYLELDSDNSQKIISEISIAECKTYLENVLLRDTDQMSMAHSLEVRAPFMDKDLIEFVFSLPDDFKPLNPQKKLLIDAMGDLLPPETWNRKKMGFTLPWKIWMNHELRTFCEENIAFLEQWNLLNVGYLQKLSQSLESDQNDAWHKVWNVVVLAQWLRTNHVKID